jgi:hypothetical protein
MAGVPTGLGPSELAGLKMAHPASLSSILSALQVATG